MIKTNVWKHECSSEKLNLAKVKIILKLNLDCTYSIPCSEKNCEKCFKESLTRGVCKYS